MKLYYADASPYARKCRVAAREAGVADRVEEVFVKVAPTTANADYAAVNPLRRVPALLADDGTLLVDSRVITEYLADQGGNGDLYPAGAARWRALAVAALAEGILDSAVGSRYESALRPAELRWQAWLDDHLGKIATTLDRIEADGVPAGGGSAGGAIDIAGVGLGCALGYLDFRFPDVAWREGRPALAAWYEAVAERPSFVETRPS